MSLRVPSARTWWRFRKAVQQAGRAIPSLARRHCDGADVVVLPCWRRPEFLWHCLDNLTRAHGIDSVHVLFRVDTGFSPDNLDVIQSFSDRLASFEVQVAETCPFRRSKPSANLLLGCLHAAAMAKQYVFLVEEDIMVARDFFAWHRSVQAACGSVFCSIPVANRNRTLALPDAADGYYLSSGDSCSNGVCFERKVLTTLIAPHVNMAYLRRPKHYIRRHFPDSPISLGYVEQDGLIRRIQEQSGLPIAWPCVPRAFHAGFFGARGGWQNFVPPDCLGASVQDRVQSLSQTIYDRDAIRACAQRPEFVDDCIPCSLQPPAWEVLRQIEVPA